jgi:hypothetical protein
VLWVHSTLATQLVRLRFRVYCWSTTTRSHLRCTQRSGASSLHAALDYPRALQPVQVVHVGTQVTLVGMSLAELLAGGVEWGMPAPPVPYRADTPSSRSDTSSRVRMLRAATKMVGLSTIAKKQALQARFTVSASLLPAPCRLLLLRSPRARVPCTHTDAVTSQQVPR